MSRPGLLCAAVLLGAAAPQAAAQAPPDTGRLMQDQERARLPAPSRPLALPSLDQASPPAPPADGQRVRTTAFRFSRNTVFDDATLAALLADLAGRELSLAELNAAAARITAYYRQHGYFIASTWLPAQDIRDGVVELTVLEGQLGKLQLDNQSLVADHVVLALLPGLREGSPLQQDSLERGLLLISGLPGVEVQSTLKPGASLGSTDLDLRIGGQRRSGGNLSLDDYGNRFSGAWRAGAQLNVNSPLGLGDALSLRASQSDAQFRYGRLAYQLPLGGAGLQLGAAWSGMRYRLGLGFAALQAHGNADIASLYALYPLQRSRFANLSLQANLERKHLLDRADSTGALSDKQVGLLTLGIAGDHADSLAGGGFTSWSVAHTGGKLRLDPASQQVDAAGHGTAGGYGKWALLAGRQQRLGGLERWSMSAQASLQLAGKNLDSSEKFSLGGAQGVRAYPQGEAACDDAWLASLALNYAAGPAWQLSGFVDGAAGKLNHAPAAADSNNRQSLSGSGLALNYGRAGGVNLAATVAWRGGRAPLSDRDRAPRFWLSLQNYF